MSTQNTKYEISTGQDLSSIFAPRLITDPSNAVTGFEYFDTTSSSYQDLSNLFLPYSTGVISATNYVSNLLPYGGKDLNIIFQQNIVPIWPYSNYNNQNTRLSLYNGAPNTPNPPLVAFINIPGTEFYSNNIVIGPTNIIYATDNISKKIYALDINLTTILFTWSTPAVIATPTIGLNNIMYYPNINQITALKDINTSTPSVYWVYSVSNPNVPIIGLNGTLYFSNNSGYLFAISSNGSFLWKTLISSGNFGLTMSLDGLTFYTILSTTLYAINSVNGSIKWNFSLLPGDQNFISIGANGTLYISYNNISITTSYIYSIIDNGATGALNWLVGPYVGLLSIISIGPLPNGNLYTTINNKILCINKNDGSTNWTTATISQAVSSIAIGSNGTLYSTGDYATVISITDNGGSYTINWNFQIGGAVSSPCSIGSNNALYFGGYNSIINKIS